MAKRVVDYTYTFTPTTSTLDLSAFPSFELSHLYFVLDLDAKSVLYAAGSPGLGYSSENAGVLVLQASMAGATAEDNLMIVYDDGSLASAAIWVQLAIGGNAASSSHRIPVEVDAQSSGLAQDTSIQSILTAIGTQGSAPPTLPATSTGIFGWLRYLATLIEAPPVGAANIATSQANIPTTAGGTLIVAARSGAPGVGRTRVNIVNGGSQTIYYGPTGLTSATGIPLAAGASSGWIDFSGALYGLSSSGTQTVYVTELY